MIVDADPVAEDKMNVVLPNLEQFLSGLGSMADEACVVSVAAILDPDGQAAEVVFGSVLWGPSAIAQESWPAWLSRTNRAVRDPGAANEPDLRRKPEFVEVHEGWLFARWSIPGTKSEVCAWLTDLFTRSVDCGSGIHRFRLTARPQSPSAKVQTSHWRATPAGRLVSGAGRPVTGYLFPLTRLAEPEPPADWVVDGRRLVDAPFDLLGLPILDPSVSGVNGQPTAAPGLFVGRMTRDAWVADIRMEPAADEITIRLGLDADRASIADLEVELEEYLDNDLANGMRLRLGDLLLPPTPTSTSEAVLVKLPTLGRGLQRRVRLTDRDGVQLDSTDVFAILERIDIQVALIDGPGTTVTVGRELQDVHLRERLDQASLARTATDQLLTDGLAHRIVVGQATGRDHVKEQLRTARGHIDILDPFFTVADWDLFDLVSVPVRVLTCRSVAGAPPLSPAGMTIDAKTWPTKPTPWHDRVYLWDGGGLTVGTSAKSLGDRDSRIDRLSRHEAQGWQTRFDGYWSTLT